MPKSKIGDNIVPLGNGKDKEVKHIPSSSVSNEKDFTPTNAQILMSHLAKIADKDGTFTASISRLSNSIGMHRVQVNYWMKKFVSMEWIIELEPEQAGKPVSYGFSLPREEVQTLVQNMPTRIVSSTQSNKPIEPKSESSQPGILAGKAMIRVQFLETRLEEFIKETRLELQGLREALTTPAKPDLSAFESVLDYLEESQKKINTFVRDTFGVDMT